MRAPPWWLLGGLAAAAGLYLYSRTQSGGAAVSDTFSAAADAVTNAYLTVTQGPRGIRNNNPGNIERTTIQWQGSMTPAQVAAAGLTWDQVYEQFTDPSHGVRAIGHVLLAKAARGLSSVDAIIRDYSATDQDAYVADVAAALGVQPQDTIDVSTRLPDLALAIIQQENGQQPYNPDDVQRWVYT